MFLQSQVKPAMWAYSMLGFRPWPRHFSSMAASFQAKCEHATLTLGSLAGLSGDRLLPHQLLNRLFDQGPRDRAAQHVYLIAFAI